MTDPYNELRADLKQNIESRFFYIQGLRDQLDRLAEWEVPGRIEALKIGSYFFRLMRTTFYRAIFVEITEFLRPSSKTSLPHWLQQAKTHTIALKPTRYSPPYRGGSGKDEPFPPEEYRALVDEHLAKLHAQGSLIKNIKAQRDKIIAHMERTFFHDPDAAYKRFPVNTDDVHELIDIIASILRKHHVHLFEADLSMRLHSSTNVDVLIRNANAFMKAKRDMELLHGEKPFRPVDYMWDEVDANNDPFDNLLKDSDADQD